MLFFVGVGWVWGNLLVTGNLLAMPVPLEAQEEDERQRCLGGVEIRLGAADFSGAEAKDPECAGDLGSCFFFGRVW